MPGSIALSDERPALALAACSGSCRSSGCDSRPLPLAATDADRKGTPRVLCLETMVSPLILLALPQVRSLE